MIPPSPTRTAVPPEHPADLHGVGHRAVFLTALVLCAFFVTYNIRSGTMPVMESRQAQTAISAAFIQEDANFSLAYPTPVLGKPWSIPMEFPLFQWSVAALSNVTGWPIHVAARVINILCFFGTLPALYLLLRQARVPRSQSWLALTLVVTSPLYLFHTRSFLIEPLALLFAAWFTTAFVAALRRRQLAWLALCVVAGVGAALVKVTTFIAWCVPAATFAGVMLWRDVRHGNLRRSRETFFWGSVAVAPALVAAWWWVRTSDAIKALNAAGADLMSARLSGYNFGSFADRFDGKIWSDLIGQWNYSVIPLWIGVIAALVGLRTPSGRRWLAIGAACFLAAQLIFPRLYAIHDYYFYPAGLFLLLGLGAGISVPPSDSRWRYLPLLLTVAVCGANVASYARGYLESQKMIGRGGTGLTDALRNVSPPDSVLVIVGSDWNSIIPYYAQRRALMVRADLEADAAYLDRALKSLEGEDVFGLIMVGSQRTNLEIIATIATRLRLDPQITFSFGNDADVYVRNFHRDRVLASLGTREAPFYYTVRPMGEPGMVAEDAIDRLVTRRERDGILAEISPAPSRYNFLYGLSPLDVEDRRFLGAHPPSRLEFDAPEGARSIEIEYGIAPGAYANSDGHTDGVIFSVVAIGPGNQRRTVFSHQVRPFSVPEDRSTQSRTIPLDVTAGTKLLFLTEAGPTANFDWAYWGRIAIR